MIVPCTCPDTRLLQLSKLVFVCSKCGGYRGPEPRREEFVEATGFDKLFLIEASIAIGHRMAVIG